MASGSASALVVLPPELAERVRPLSLACERTLPVDPHLAPLLPGAGLSRGTVVAVDALVVAFRLISAATHAGSWAALVRGSAPWMPGLAAAREQGVALERLALVRAPAGGAAVGSVLAALVDGVDLVLFGDDVILTPSVARSLASRVRERGAVLVCLRPPGAPAAPGWPDRVDLTVSHGPPVWEGLEAGHGHLRRARIPVTVTGRGAAARPRRGWVPWGPAEPTWSSWSDDLPEGERDGPPGAHAYGLVS